MLGTYPYVSECACGFSLFLACRRFVPSLVGVLSGRCLPLCALCLFGCPWVGLWPRAFALARPLSSPPSSLFGVSPFALQWIGRPQRLGCSSDRWGRRWRRCLGCPPCASPICRSCALARFVARCGRRCVGRRRIAPPSCTAPASHSTLRLGSAVPCSSLGSLLSAAGVGYRRVVAFVARVFRCVLSRLISAAGTLLSIHYCRLRGLLQEAQECYLALPGRLVPTRPQRF